MTHLPRLFRGAFYEPWDVLFKDFFNRDSFFAPAVNTRPNYPVDIYENEDSVIIEIAAVGLDKEDLKINEENGVLSVSYDRKGIIKDDFNFNDLDDEVDNAIKPDNDHVVSKKSYTNYIQQGIARRSFCLSWRFSDKFNLSKIEASMDKGILKIVVPKYEEKAIKKNCIKIK